MLSLQEPVESQVLKVSRSEALILSVGVHLLIVLLFLFGPLMATRYLPQTIVAFFTPRPPAERIPVTMIADARPPAAPKQPSKIPMRFTYVNVPHDEASGPNPKAPLFSDKNRRARQEVPTPSDTRKFSIDPHSVGKTIERNKPDPSHPTGRDDVEAQNRARRGDPNDPALGAAAKRNRRLDATSTATPSPFGKRAAGAESADDANIVRSSDVPNEDTPGDRGATGGTGTDPGARENLKQALSNLKSGDYKFQFNNPMYLRAGGDLGSLSFDTQGFPWGEYARRIYPIIRNNWMDRYPLAAREGGIRGWVCQHFVIEKNGTISSIDVVRASGVAPFDRVAAEALAASSALPPLPEDFPEPREGVTGCFYYNMAPGEDGE